MTKAEGNRTGAPCSPRAYMGRKRILPMLSLHVQGFLISAAVSVPTHQKRWVGCAHLIRPMYALANTPNFLHAALDKSPCAPFFKERRMRFLEPIGLNRKFGAMGHPSDFLRLWL